MLCTLSSFHPDKRACRCEQVVIYSNLCRPLDPTLSSFSNSLESSGPQLPRGPLTKESLGFPNVPWNSLRLRQSPHLPPCLIASPSMIAAQWKHCHIRPQAPENSGSRLLSPRQASERQTSSWVGDDQRIPDVVCRRPHPPWRNWLARQTVTPSSHCDEKRDIWRFSVQS